MIFFLNVYFLLFFFSFLSIEKNISKYSGYFLLFSLFFLSLISGLRSSNFGQDYNAYQNIFYQFDGLFNGGLEQFLDRGEYFFEPGFAFIIVIIKIFTNDHVIFFLVISLITSAIMFISIGKTSLYPMSALLVFFSYMFFTNHVTAIRFGLASSLGLLSLLFVSNKKKISSFFVIALATSMHTASIVLFVPYLILIFSFKVKKIHLLVVTILALFLGSVEAGSYLIDFLPSWIPRYNSAIAYTSDTQYGETLGFLSLINIKYLFLVMLTYLCWGRISKDNFCFNEIVIFILSALFLRVGFHDIGFIIGRTSALLGIVEMLLVPIIAFAVFRKKIAFLIVSTYSLANLFFLLVLKGPYEYSSVIFE